MQLKEAIGSRELRGMAIDEECAVALGAPGYVNAQADHMRKACPVSG